MAYFNQFPSVNYRFEDTDGNQTELEYTNLIAFSAVIDDIIEDQTTYSYHTIHDGERPDILSYRLYGTVDYYWTFYIMNPHLKYCGWPLSSRDLQTKMDEDLPGQCLVFLPQQEVSYGSETGWTQHEMIENFPIGSTVYQTQGSGDVAIGTVYARNVNLGQIFVRNDNDVIFANNTIIVNSLSAPTEILIPRIIFDPAHLATHHFEDGDGDHVDVDFSLDFRGRASELSAENVSGLPEGAGPGPDGNYLGGVVGDPVNPDPYSGTSPYTNVTYKEFYQNTNDAASRIKILKPNIVGRFVALHKQSLKT